jgi:chromate transport protein ChrA
MVSGLALAETTPGPLIMVVQFVAFLGAYNDPGALDPWVAAVLASLLVCWVTFVPCFLFVLLGAPYVERLRHNTHLAAALTGVTAAVVGVIANLAAFFALHTLFDETRHVSAGILQLDVPVLGSADPVAFVITAVALVLMLGRGWSPLRTLGLCALLGIASAVPQLCDPRQVAPTAATSGSSCGLSMSAASMAAAAESPRIPRRLVEHRPDGELAHPVRDARSSIAAAQVAVCAWEWRGRARRARRGCGRRARRTGRPGGWCAPGRRGARRRPVHLTLGLGQQGQPAGGDALPAGVADLAGPCERLLEGAGGGVEVTEREPAWPSMAWARAGTRASGRARPGRRRTSGSRWPRRGRRAAG